jgi:hypothetical protein
MAIAQLAGGFLDVLFQYDLDVIADRSPFIAG